jgi:hypothetical protein
MVGLVRLRHEDLDVLLQQVSSLKIAEKIERLLRRQRVSP